MKYRVLLLAFALVTVFILSEAIDDNISECRKNTRACSESVRCCSKYCRDQRCIEYGDDPNDVNRTNPCFYTKCRSGTVCVVEQVQCKTSPCPGVSRCVSSTPKSCEN